MTCKQTQTRLSEYIDTALAGSEMQSIRAHISVCPECSAEHRSLEEMRGMVASIGRRQAPADLALRIRLAVSRQRAESRRRWFEGVLVRMEDAFRSTMVPATAGLLSAIVFFGLLIGFWAMPAVSNDVPVPSLAYTPPQLTAMPADSIDGVNEPILVETFVDEKGRVEDYRILTQGVDNSAIQPQLDSIMIFTLFEPARVGGRPTQGHAVISFSNIKVKG